VGEAINNLQTVLDSGEGDRLAPAVRRYVQIVTDTLDLFDQRKDAILGLS